MEGTVQAVGVRDTDIVQSYVHISHHCQIWAVWQKNGAKYKLYLIGVLLLKLYAVQDESNNIRIATNAGKL